MPGHASGDARKLGHSVDQSSINPAMPGHASGDERKLGKLVILTFLNCFEVRGTRQKVRRALTARLQGL